MGEKAPISILGCFLLLLAIPDHSKGQYLQSTTIRSPEVTNWGDWGAWEECKPGKYVVGFQLKTEAKRGFWTDDTALNGIELQCATIGSTGIDSRITSKIGGWGDWGSYYRCPTGSIMTGFQLRSEPFSGASQDDDTAANNLIGFCSSATTYSRTTQMTGDGLDWGEWSTAQHCPRGYGICGLSTQVEPPHGAHFDDTSLSNVAMRCCPLPVETTTTTPAPENCNEAVKTKCLRNRTSCGGRSCNDVCASLAHTVCSNAD